MSAGQVQTTGIVIRVKPYGERDKLVTLLTADRGVITVSAKGALKLTASFSRCTQLYAYSHLTLYEKNGFYTLLEGALIASFFSLSENLDCFALAAYLCEASAAVVVPNDGEGEILNLLLNALYALKSNLFTPEFIKAVFELRLAALSGLEPTVGACPGCGRPLAEADERYFFLTEGLILCPACASGRPADETPYRLSRAVYAAIAYVTAAKPKAIFSFRIGDEALHDLSVVAEKYLQNQLERTFPTLEFYKTTRQIPSE